MIAGDSRRRAIDVWVLALRSTCIPLSTVFGLRNDEYLHGKAHLAAVRESMYGAYRANPYLLLSRSAIELISISLDIVHAIHDEYGVLVDQPLNRGE